MRGLVIFAIAVCLVIVVGPAPSYAESPAGTISGTVRIGNDVAANVVVALYHESSQFYDAPLATTRTDGEGKFRFESVAEGRYRVDAHAPAFVVTSAETFGYSGVDVTLNAGEIVDLVDIRLERGGVITGRVTDTAGRAVVAEAVTLAPADPAGPPLPERFRYRLVLTDDRGVYRIYGIPSGRYFVSVGVSPERRDRVVGRARHPYTLTYHPSTSARGAATAVEVAPGGEASGVDIVVAETQPTATLDGVAVGEDGSPIAGAFIHLARIESDNSVVVHPQYVLANAEGKFSIVGLAHGAYRALARAEALGLVSDPIEIALPKTSSSPTRLVLKPALSISGRIVVAGGVEDEVRAGLASARLSAYRVDDDPASAVDDGSSTTLLPGDRFSFEALRAGRYHFSIHRQDRSAVIVIMKIAHRGVAIESIDLAAESIADLEIHVALGRGTIRGLVTAADHPSPQMRHASVVISLAGAERVIASSSVDERGAFLISNVPDGEYEVQAVESRRDEQGRWTAYRSKPILVTIVRNGDAEVRLELEPQKPQEQP